MRLSWPALLSNLRNAIVRAQHPSADHTFLSTFQSVMSHNLFVAISLQAQGPGWTPTALTSCVFIPYEDFVIAVQSPALQLASPTSLGSSSHSMTW